MDRVFAVGDIHGQIQHIQTLLRYWNPDNQQLILLGDLIDRGEDSLEVILLAKKLKETYGAIILTGNHELMFLDWLQHPYHSTPFYYPHGGRETIHSFFDESPMTFLKTPEEIAQMINTQFQEEIQFLANLPRYYEWNPYVFVHAGVDLNNQNWKETNEDDFCWIRDEFYQGVNHTGNIFVVGHTPTELLNPDGSCEVWISPCHTKIAIDGGAVFGGLLHSIQIEKDQPIATNIAVYPDLQVRKKTISLTI